MVRIRTGKKIGRKYLFHEDRVSDGVFSTILVIRVYGYDIGKLLQLALSNHRSVIILV